MDVSDAGDAVKDALGSVAPVQCAEDMYKQNVEEIRRRAALKDAGGDAVNSATFEPSRDVMALPFQIDSQRFFVWSASHIGMAPIAKQAHSPAIRIYGLFATEQEAVDHAKLVHSLDPSASVLVSPTHSWTVLPKDPNRLADAAKLQSHIDEVLRIHTNTLQASTDTFQENVREHKTGDGAAREDADAQRALKAARDKHNTERLRDMQSSSTVLRRDAEVRDQTLVAISYVRDARHEECPEPIFRVYAAFSTEQEGDAWARNAGNTVLDHDIDLVSTTKWLHLHEVQGDKLNREVYRSSELNNIMETHKKAPIQAEQYRMWREQSKPGEVSK